MFSPLLWSLSLKYPALFGDVECVFGFLFLSILLAYLLVSAFKTARKMCRNASGWACFSQVVLSGIVLLCVVVFACWVRWCFVCYQWRWGYPFSVGKITAVRINYFVVEGEMKTFHSFHVPVREGELRKMLSIRKKNPVYNPIVQPDIGIGQINFLLDNGFSWTARFSSSTAECLLMPDGAEYLLDNSELKHFLTRKIIANEKKINPMRKIFEICLNDWEIVVRTRSNADETETF